MPRLPRIVALLMFTFFGLNHSWTHVALASLSGEMRTCPSAPVSEARTRVEAFVGKVHAAPWIICQRQSVFGLNVSHGTARFAPFMPSFIVVGPFGINTDVIAHEWMHAEIAARTSALLRTYRIPTWFDEGLAMQLDQRPDYGERALGAYKQAGLLSTRNLQQLASPGQFFSPGDHGKAHYAFARCVVGRWLAASDRVEAMKLLERVGWGRSFPDQEFEGHARSCLEQSP